MVIEKNSDKLDTLNNKRVETTTLRVIHAIKLLTNNVECLVDNRIYDNALNDIAHAVDLLSAANTDMKYACSHFNWDCDICDSIMSACRYLGECMAYIIDKNDDEDRFSYAGSCGQTALGILGTVLASLVRWFDDTQDVSEV